MSKLNVDRYGKVTVESSITAATMSKVEKFAPNATCILDVETKDELYIITRGTGGISKYGVSFNGVTTDTGTLFLSFDDHNMPADAGKKRAYLEETYGPMLFKLNQVEGQVNAALESVAADIATVATNITIQ